MAHQLRSKASVNGFPDIPIFKFPADVWNNRNYRACSEYTIVLRQYGKVTESMELLTLENMELLMPENMELLMPENMELLMLENMELLMPENMELLILENME
ncbi:hypothetical protein ACOMHN_013513 [Nucella lapillus]